MIYLLSILCLFLFSCEEMLEIRGCTYENTLNYDEYATVDNGNCIFEETPESVEIEGKTYNLDEEETDSAEFASILSIIAALIFMIPSVFIGVMATALYAGLLTKLREGYDYFLKKIKKESTLIFEIPIGLGYISIYLFWGFSVCFSFSFFTHIPIIRDLFFDNTRGIVWFTNIMSWFLE